MGTRLAALTHLRLCAVDGAPVESAGVAGWPDPAPALRPEHLSETAYQAIWAFARAGLLPADATLSVWPGMAPRWARAELAIGAGVWALAGAGLWCLVA